MLAFEVWRTLFKKVNFSKPYGRQRVNNKRFFLKIEIICGFHKNQFHFNQTLAISKIFQHFSPSELTHCRPQDTVVTNGDCRGHSTLP